MIQYWTNKIKQTINKVKQTTNKVKNKIKQTAQKAKNTYNTVKNKLKSGLTKAKSTYNSLKDKAKNTGNAIKNSLKNTNWKDAGHAALDIAGFVPVIGAAADLTNAAWYAAEGDYANAALSGISAIPGLGDAVGAAAKGGKLIAKVSKGNKLLTGAGKLLPNAGKVIAKVTKGNKLLAGASNLLPNAGKLTDLAKLTKKIPGKLGEVVKKIPLPNKVKNLVKGAVKYGVPAAVHGVNVAGFVGGVSAAQEYIKKGDYVNAALVIVSGSAGLGHTVKSVGKLGKGKVNGVENKVKGGGGKNNKLSGVEDSKGGFERVKDKEKGTVYNGVGNKKNISDVKSDRDLPVTGKQKEILGKTASKRGSELTRQELDTELELVGKAKSKPADNPEYIEQKELPNGHEWKRREDGAWCRFSEKTDLCLQLPLQLPDGKQELKLKKGQSLPLEKGWRKADFGDNNLIYVLKDPETGELLKVGQTTEFIARFKKYLTAQKATEIKLEVETYLVPKSEEIPLETFETHLRQKLISEGHKLPWDNTGSRLGLVGRVSPGLLTPEQQRLGYQWEKGKLILPPGTKIDLPKKMQSLRLEKGWRKVDFGDNDFIYVVKDADTGELLKVGQTTDDFKNRFEKYMGAQNKTGKQLEIDIYPVSKSETIPPLTMFETLLREKLILEGHKLPWDNTGVRLGKKGSATPGIK